MARKFFLVISAVFLSTSAAAIDQYVATENIQSSNGYQISVGQIVDVVGINKVPQRVSPSGQLITFLKGNEVHTADASGFERLTVNQQVKTTALQSKQHTDSTAALCTTLYQINDLESWLRPSSAEDLSSYIQVFDKDRVIPISISLPDIQLNDEETSRWDVSGTDICLQGLEFSKVYKIRLNPGLSLATCLGKNCRPLLLQDELVIWGETDAAPSTIKLSSGQTILPAKQKALVPLKVRNISNIDVTVFEVDIRSINSSSYLFNDLGGYSTDSFERGVGLKVGEFRVPVDAKTDSELEINIDLTRIIPAEKPGLFVAIFDSEALDLSLYENRPTQWLIRSNLAISSYHGVNETQVLLTEFDTGGTVPQAEVTVLAANNRVLYQGETNSQGLVSIPSAVLSGFGNHRPEYLFARVGNNELSILKFSAEGNRLGVGNSGHEKEHDRDVYITSDRYLYRAGERIEYILITRDLLLNPLIDVDFKIELFDPEYNAVYSQIVTSDQFGFISGGVDLKNTARLGEYQLRVSGIDGAELANHVVKVEDFVPLTIETKITTNEIWQSSLENNFEITAQYFSGGSAVGLAAEVVTALGKSNQHEHPQLEGYRFGETNSVAPQPLREFEIGALDSDGSFSGSLVIDGEYHQESGLYNVHFKGSTFDVGGRPNSSFLKVALNTHEEYLGIKPNFEGALQEGSSPSFSVVNVTRGGDPLPIPNYNFKISRIYYDFNWYYDSGWRYRRVKTDSEVVVAGSSQAALLEIGQGLDWGFYEVVVESEQGFKSKADFWSGWYGDKPISEPSILPLSVGWIDDENLLVRLTAPFDGSVRLMEATSDVVSASSFAVSKGENEFIIPSTVKSEPGFHVLATLIRPVKSGSEHLPQLAVGAQWIRQLKANRIIDTNLIVEPQQTSNDRVSIVAHTDASRGKARIFLIDDGIHAITGYSNNNPGDFFYGNRRLSIGFLTNFGSLIKQDENLKAFSVGGDQAGGGAVAKSDFFDTVVASSPELELVDGKISYEFPAPQMEGRLRAVLIVAGVDGVGIAEANIRIQDKISIDTSLPRFVGIGDNVAGKVAFRSNEPFNEPVEVTLRAGENTSEFDIGSSKSLDPIEKSIGLQSMREGENQVELAALFESDSIERSYTLIARPSSYPMSEIYSVKLEPKLFSDKMKVDPLDVSRFSKDSINVLWSISGFSGVSMSTVSEALARYPYGCLEQTSSTLTGILASSNNLEASSDAAQRVKVGVENLLRKQKANGSFGYWDRNGPAEHLFLPFAIDALTHSRKYVQDVSNLDASLKRALTYMDAQLFDDLWVNIYSTGLLAQYGYEVTSRAKYVLDKLLGDELEGLRNYELTGAEKSQKLRAAKAAGDRLDLLAAGYWLAVQINDDQRKKSLSDSLSEVLEDTEPFMGSGIFDNKNRWFKPSKHSKVDNLLAYWRPKSGVLVGRLSPADRSLGIDRYSRKAIEQIARWDYRSTFDNANLAVLLSGEQRKPQDVTITVNGSQVNVLDDNSIALDLQNTFNGFQIAHDSELPIYLNAEIVGIPSGNEPINNGLQVSKKLISEAGDELEPRNGRIEVAQGDIVTILVEVKPLHTLEGRLTITDLLPSGFEIESKTIIEPRWRRDGNLVNLKDIYEERPDWSESMDDRYVASVKKILSSDEPFAIFYQVRASYSGTMVIPDAHAELMYRPEINGRSASLNGAILPRD